MIKRQIQSKNVKAKKEKERKPTRLQTLQHPVIKCSFKQLHNISASKCVPLLPSGVPQPTHLHFYYGIGIPPLPPLRMPFLTQPVRVFVLRTSSIKLLSLHFKSNQCIPIKKIPDTINDTGCEDNIK